MQATVRRRPLFLLFAKPQDPERDEARNPYPPQGSPPGNGDRRPASTPERFQRYWLMIITVVGFVLGAYLLSRDLEDGDVGAVPAIIYMTMMGYLPLAALAGLLKR